MSFLSILVALLLEQVRPLGRHNPIRQWLAQFIHVVRRAFDAGQSSHALLIWLVLAILPATGVALVQLGLAYVLGWPAVLAWNIVVLYLTLGFRQFSYHLTGIRKALDDNDQTLARQLLAEWRHLDTREFRSGHIYQRVLEASTMAAHRSVFGVFFWYAVLSSMGLGPAGAVFYRCAELAYRLFNQEGRDTPVGSDALRGFFSKAWALIDWLPVRMTAISFAMVGNFEEVVDRWRSLPIPARRLSVSGNKNLLLVAAFAAVNIPVVTQHLMGHNLGFGDEPGSEGGGHKAVMDDGLAQAHRVEVEPDIGMLELNLLVGLVWRALILWMLLLALLSAANLLG
jgi:adenosylcobinamide-phosphate synthase